MHGPRDQAAAAARSRWLAELAEAIDQALKLGREFWIAESPCAEAKEVYGRLESVRNEVEALRRGHRTLSPKETGPLWTRLFPWRGTPRG